jgi:hypothetical protein
MSSLTTDPTLPVTMRRNALAVLPAPIIAGAVILMLVGPPPIIPLVVGAAGWMLALVLRQPVALVASKTTTPERAATIVGWFSGPAEELVRLVLVLALLRTFDDAIWFGFGWATIEVLLVFVNGLVIANLITKDDPKSVEERELLLARGMLGTQHAAWGLLERLSATALHLGFTLMLFAQPWLVLVTLPVHSTINMLMARFAKNHLAVAELALAVVGIAVLVVGVAMSGR